MAEVHKEWSRWLQGVFGSSEVLTLGTFTFRNPDSRLFPNWTGPGRQFVTRAARKLEGFLEANGSSGIVVVEEGSSTRRLHLHSLSSSPRPVLKQVELWSRRAWGHVALREVRSREGVSMYVTKYVTKADIMFFAGGPAFHSAANRLPEAGPGPAPQPSGARLAGHAELVAGLLTGYRSGRITVDAERVGK